MRSSVFHWFVAQLSVHLHLLSKTLFCVTELVCGCKFSVALSLKGLTLERLKYNKSVNMVCSSVSGNLLVAYVVAYDALFFTLFICSFMALTVTLSDLFVVLGLSS